MAEIRRFLKDDFNQVLALLNRSLEFDKFTSALLEEKLFADPSWDPELCFVVGSENHLTGFIQGVHRDVRGVRLGYVKLFAVDPLERRKGVGSMLYKTLEEGLIRKNSEVIRAFDVPLNYFMPGIDPRYTPALCFFERMGFLRFGDTSNMSVDLRHQSFSISKEQAELEKEDILLTRAGEADMDELLSLIDTEWALWRHEVKIAFASQPPAVFIARAQGKIKAFAAHNGNNLGTGWFGPMGTHPDLRGKGIGGLLLKLCLEDIRSMGLEVAIIPWVGPVSFYAWQVNAQISRVFHRYQKKINPGITI
jgi:mycothiol synthase